MKPTAGEGSSLTQSSQIKWNDFNYPPLLKLFHFRMSQLPEDRKQLIVLLFVIHIAVVCNTILNIIADIIDCCNGRGIGILYGFLFFFIFNPFVLFLFYRAYIGLCKEKSMLGLFIYLWPIVVAAMITVSILGVPGFNGFIAVSLNFQPEGKKGAGVLGIIISLIYLGLAALGSYLYYRIFKERSILTKLLL